MPTKRLCSCLPHRAKMLWQAIELVGFLWGIGWGTESVVFADALERPRTQEPKPDHPTSLLAVDEAWQQLALGQKQQIDRVVLQAYLQSIAPQGSSDLVLIHETLRRDFLDQCRHHWAALADSATDHPIDDSLFCWRLLSLRKAGKLPSAQGRMSWPPITAQQRLLAEIVSRRSEDRFHQSLDRILVDSRGRAFWEEAAMQMTSAADLDQLRRAALTLRKTRQLRPELSARLIDWPIEHRSYSYQELVADLSTIPPQPGIYLFRDTSGYLYIGEAQDLRQRLSTHFKLSDRQSLADYLQQAPGNEIHIDLHIFPVDSPGRNLSVRRAYESELIRSRQPKFNLRP
jgi:hypothetical protein